MAVRTDERIKFLTDLLSTAIEHCGYGFPGVKEYEPSEDGAAFAVIYDRHDGDSGRIWRVDLDTMARGLGVIRSAALKFDPKHPDDGEVYHNRETGERLYFGGEMRRQLLLADRTNGADGDYDVIGALAALECALFGRVVYG